MVLESTDRSFGSVLKAFRTRRQLTQHQLAAQLGVRRNTLGSWERGDFLPQSRGVVLELARCLHLNDHETRQLLEASLTALSPYWSVPLPRNPFFTGREEILEALHRQLGVDQAVALTQSSALHGLGGVGKTQIALEYAYRHALEYSAIFWIGAETVESIASSLLRIAEVLRLSGREDQNQQRIIELVQHWLSTHSRWLVIWDNLEDLDLLDRFLPPTRSGAVLITTRRQALGTLARGLNLLPMEQEEGVLFLLRRAKALDAEASSEQIQQFAHQVPVHYSAAVELVGVLGGLPLALDQAGAYLEATQCGLSAYMDLFHTRRAALLALRGEGVRDHPASITTTFTLALRAIAEHHPATLDLLRVCSLLQPDAIPEELFHQDAEHLGMQLQTVCRDPLEWNKIVGVASSYSLLSRQPTQQTLSIHRLVQAVLVEGMAKTEQEQWHQCVIQALEAMFPDVGPLTASADRQQGRRLLPHAFLVLRQATGASASLSLASLAYKTAQYLREGGQYAEAQPLFARALHLYEQILGLDGREVALVCNYLGVLSAQQGQYAEARPYFVRALRIYELQDPDHPDIARPLENLANLLKNEAHYAEALPLLHRVLRIRERAYGPGHQKLAQTFHNLGDLYVSQEQYAEAKPYLVQALHLLEQSPDQPPMALTLTLLGEVCSQLGQYPEAQRSLVRAWSLWRKLVEPGHPAMAYTLARLGRLAFARGDTARAGRFYHRALRLWEPHPQHDPPELAALLTNLAEVSQARGEDAEAVALYRRALGILAEHLGPKHPRTAHALRALALLRERQGGREVVSSLAQQARAIGLQESAEAHPAVIAGPEQTAAPAPPIAKQDETATTGTRNAERQAEEALRSLRQKRDEAFSPSYPLQAFLEVCCERHPLAWCRSSDLWQAYELWSREQQERYPLSRMAFTQQLKAAGFRTDRTNSARIWRGITLVDREIVTGSDG